MEGLMGPRTVVERDELPNQPPKLVFAQDEDVIEKLASQCARESLGEGTHVGDSHGGAHDRTSSRRRSTAERT
jgi:hypothetical protein